MNMNFAHMWETMSPINKGIFYFLGAMLLITIIVFVERLIAFGSSQAESRKFAKAAAPLIEKWDPQAIVKLAEKHKRSALAQLFSSIITRFERGAADPDGGMSPIELARNEAARKQQAIGHSLRRGMSMVATIGSIAPFVGLLGTVIGIIIAFQGIAATGAGGLGAVSAGISEALIETAFGLCVAIPGVIAYNYLTGRVGSMELALRRSAGELLDEMEHNYGREPEYGE